MFDDHDEPIVTTGRAPQPRPCPESPTGFHQLRSGLYLQGRDDVRFPSGTYLRCQCRHCGRQGTAFLPDAHIAWDMGATT